MTTSRRLHRYGILMAAVLAIPAGQAVHAQPTEIEEIVLYGIDADTDQLLRYTFDTDEFIVIGVVEPGAHCEAIGWVPAGSARGMYAVPSEGSLADSLIKIDPFDGSASPFMDPNLRVTGATSYYDAGLGAWVLLMVEHKDDYLFTLDPRTGNITYIMDCANFEGLAMWSDGHTVYGNTTTELYKVDLNTKSEELIGTITSADKCESLEFAFGDFGAAITVPGVPAAWTQDGLLVGFDDDLDGLLIIDPATADAVRYSCSFASIDVEGIVFTTQSKDPYGRIVADPHD
jgi:hypothetical protein